jgi:cold shock CspA family protein
MDRMPMQRTASLPSGLFGWRSPVSPNHAITVAEDDTGFVALAMVSASGRRLMLGGRKWARSRTASRDAEAADDGEVLFVQFSGIVREGYRSLRDGQRVSFIWGGEIQAHGQHRATEVRAEG